MFEYKKVPAHYSYSDLEVFFIPQRTGKRKIEYKKILPPFLEHSAITDDIKGEYKESIILYPKSDDNLSRIQLAGLGDTDSINAEKFRELGYLIGKTSAKFKTKNIRIHCEDLQFDLQTAVEAIADGFLFSRYIFDRYKSEKQKQGILPKVIFFGAEEAIKQNLSASFKKIEAIHSGIALTRDLANEPSNFLTPQILKKKTAQIFKKVTNIYFDFFDKKKLSEMNMYGILSVAKGSAEEPYLLIIHYKPAKSNGKKIALVGKGVTFDSGGISIKPAAQMDEMKFDMAGAATVLGILKSVSLIQPETEIIGIVPAVENMPGHRALKPGDVIKAYNGKTIEIINTDAEGRLILADALSFAVKKYNPDLLIDFATLTGAVEVALGDKMAGMFTKSDSVSTILSESGEYTGDRVWRMPLLDSYNKDIESKIADLKNLGGRWGGAVTAAKFLENFVADITWVHLDIAGVAYDVKNIDYLPDGATGFGVRLFINALEKLTLSAKP